MMRRIPFFLLLLGCFTTQSAPLAEVIRRAPATDAPQTLIESLANGDALVYISLFY